MSETPLEGLSREELEQRLAHALAVGDERAAGSVEVLLARCLLDAGEIPGARRHAERAVALQRQVQPATLDLARALEVFGRAARRGGDDDAATGAYLEAIDVAGRLGHRDVVAGLLEELGGMAATAGDRGRARDLLTAALRTAPEPREDGARRAELGLARIELDDGDDSSAARRALRVLHGGAQGEVALEGALLLRDAAVVAAARADQETARRRCEIALPVIREHGTAAALVALLAILAAACRQLVDLPAARGVYEEAVERCEQIPDERQAVVVRSGLLLDLGVLCLVDMADPTAAGGYLEAALSGYQEAGLVEAAVEASRRLHQAATARGDSRGVRRWHVAAERAAFVAAVARQADAVARRRRVGDMPATIFGDTGGVPASVRVPGGRVSEGMLWRRRLVAELRRTAPRHRVAILRGAAHARSAGSPLGESMHMLLVERDHVEARVAEVARGGDGGGCGPWVPAGDDAWPAGEDRLVEALRDALG